MSAPPEQKPTETQNLPATTAQVRPPVAVPVGRNGVMIESLDALWRFSAIVAHGGFAPKGLEKQEAIACAVQFGLEIGLSPMSALQNIAVINGRPGIYGDAALGLVRNSGLMESFEEWYEVDGVMLVNSKGKPRNPTPAELKNDTCTAWTSTKRKDAEETCTGFSISEAKVAGLWDPAKGGPWKTYPARMLKFRARGFNLRDNFGDVLKGLRTKEELDDMPLEELPPPPIGRVRLNGNGNGHALEPSSAADPSPAAASDTSSQASSDASGGSAGDGTDWDLWSDDMQQKIDQCVRSVRIERYREEIRNATDLPEGHRKALLERCDKQDQELAPKTAVKSPRIDRSF